MKNSLIVLIIFTSSTALGQCDQYFKKYESMISKTSYYLGKDMRLADAGTIAGSLDLYTDDDKVYLQTLLPVADETCWDMENSSITFLLASGAQVMLKLTDVNDECNDISPSGTFLISPENMTKLENSEARSFIIKYQAYSEEINIPAEVKDDMMDPDIKAYPQKQLKESMTCLKELGF